jgi:AcrR family transcriptional regulator
MTPGDETASEGGTTAAGGRRVRGRTAEQRRQDRREALLEAGLDLFGTKGYAATTVEEVCRRAYVTTRNFYAEFANREALLVAVGERIGGEVYLAAGTVAGAPGRQGDAPPGDGGGRIGAEEFRRLTRAHVSALVHAVTDDPRKARIAFVEYVGVSPENEVRRREARRAYAAVLADVLAPALDARGLGRARHQPFVLALTGGVDELIADWALHPDDRGSVDELIDVVTAFTLAVLGLG